MFPDTYSRDMFYTYILYSEVKDRYYTGYTSNIPLARLDQHNNGMNPSTKSGIPWSLVFYVHFEGKSDAIQFENFIKAQKSKAFIEFLIGSKQNQIWE